MSEEDPHGLVVGDIVMLGEYNSISMTITAVENQEYVGKVQLCATCVRFDKDGKQIIETYPLAALRKNENSSFMHYEQY